MSKNILVLVIALCGLLLTPLAAHAGGWVLVSLVDIPANVAAEQATAVQFRVLRHGIHPESGLTPLVMAKHIATGALVEVEAQPAEEDGLYEATLLFPMTGEWAWEIYPFAGAGFPMPTLDVQELAAATAEGEASDSPWLMLLTFPLVAAVAFIFSHGWPRSTGRWVVAGLCVIAVVSISVWSLAPPSFMQPDVAEAAYISPAAFGADLFVAKGCRQCHVNLNAEGETLFMIGPNLTDYEANPAFLRKWLADPQSVRSQTLMPNLDLTDDEIEALILFLDG